MKPNTYRPSTPAPRSQPQPRPHLTLIPGEGKPPRPAGRWIALAAMLIGTTLFWMIRGTREMAPTTNQLLERRFEQLEPILRGEGILTFLEAKARLKMQVADALRENEQDDTAQQIAVYLFPELLPDSDFEKDPAGDLWSHSEALIEAQPHSNLSRTAYLELQNQIWQYEATDHLNPAVTPVASVVLRIYQALSAP